MSPLPMNVGKYLLEEDREEQYISAPYFPFTLPDILHLTLAASMKPNLEQTQWAVLTSPPLADGK